MIKSTAKELKKDARFTEHKQVMEYLKENNLQVVKSEKIAYCDGIYGCNGFLLRLTLSNGFDVKAFTGRSTWMYTCDNSDCYNY